MTRRSATLLPALSLSLSLSLAGCGDYPRPFMHLSDSNGSRLAQPPPSRLAVPKPAGALLPDDAAWRYANEVAGALVDTEVPAYAARDTPAEWHLVLGADLRGAEVVPTFSVENPKGESAGISEGAAVPAAAWSAADPATLHAAAVKAAISVATLLIRIEATRLQSDPNSLYNRPAKVMVADVTGAPGDGDVALTRLLRDELPKLGEMVVDQARGADFSVRGQVAVVPGEHGMQRVEIQWIVADATGAERGRIVQLNEVAPGTLDQYWGEVALVVAHEAAGGVKDVILEQSGRRHAEPVAPSAAKPAS